MRESMGGAFVYSVVIAIVGIILLLLVGSIGYSKAFKVNSRIIDIIEQHNGFTTGPGNTAEKEIGEALGEIGYRVGNGNKTCETKQGVPPTYPTQYTYEYCVYEHNSNRGKYYTVVTYMYFDFPVIGDFLRIPFTNQTKTLGLFEG